MKNHLNGWHFLVCIEKYDLNYEATKKRPCSCGRTFGSRVWRENFGYRWRCGNKHRFFRR